MSRRAYPRTPPIGRPSISGVSSSFIRHPSPATNSAAGSSPPTWLLAICTQLSCPEPLSSWL